jgi:hypothetical protein
MGFVSFRLKAEATSQQGSGSHKDSREAEAAKTTGKRMACPSAWRWKHSVFLLFVASAFRRKISKADTLTRRIGYRPPPRLTAPPDDGCPPDRARP